MGTDKDGVHQIQACRQLLVCGCSASTGSAAAGSSSSSNLCSERQQQYAASCHQQVIRHMRSRSRMSAVMLATLLLASLAGVWGVPTKCRTAPPVCPSRSEALARKPMFDMETSAHLYFDLSSSKAGSSTHSQHKASAQGTQSHASLLTEGSVHGARKEGLFMRQGTQQGNMPPQRVMPSADLPKLSGATQQQLFSQLQAVLQGEGTSSIVRGPAGTPAPATTPGSTVAQPKPGCATQGGCGTLFLNNARLRVGVDTDRGGAISFVSSPVMPPEWANVNLVNTWDAGRLIQQSYYGCYDNTCWVDRPWRWNPVQGGSWQNGPPKLLASRMGAASITTASVPRNWGGQQLLDDVLMVTETELHPNVAKVRFTMRYTGTEPHPDAHQEVPAIFVNRRLNVLALYTGEKPWSNDDLTFIMPGQVGEYYRPTERWAAYVDQASGFGLGVYSPVASQLVAYRIGPENSTARNDVSYMAPLVTSNIQPNTEFSYDAYIAVGRVDEMRGWFAEIASRVAPQNEAGSYRRPIPTLLLPTNGGRSTDAARLPALLFEPKSPAVKLTPGGANTVKFSKAMSTAADFDIDTTAASPPPIGLKLTPKPVKHSPPSKPAKVPSPAVTPKAQRAFKTYPQAPAAAQPNADPPPKADPQPTAILLPKVKPLPNARLAGDSTGVASGVLPAAAALPKSVAAAQMPAPVARRIGQGN